MGLDIFLFNLNQCRFQIGLGGHTDELEKEFEFRQGFGEENGDKTKGISNVPVG